MTVNIEKNTEYTNKQTETQEEVERRLSIKCHKMQVLHSLPTFAEEYIALTYFIGEQRTWVYFSGKSSYNKQDFSNKTNVNLC